MFNSHRNYGKIKCLWRLLEIQKATIDKIGISYPIYKVRIEIFLL